MSLAAYSYWGNASRRNDEERRGTLNSHNAGPNIFCAKQAFEGGLLGWAAHIGRETCGTVVLTHGGREACWAGMLPLDKDRGKEEQKEALSQLLLIPTHGI